jgi:apolipoprotein N-acyltransferase
MLGGLAFFLAGLFWIDTLHHVHLVAYPLLGPLIRVMSIGIMGILYRARGLA